MYDLRFHAVEYHVAQIASCVMLMVVGRPVGSRPAPPSLSSSFEHYYRHQLTGPLDKREVSDLFEALKKPLPLVLRVSDRAPLAARALKQLVELIGEDIEDQRQLQWVSDRAWQFRLASNTRGNGRETGGKSYHRFLQQQQSRGALQRQESASMLPALLLAPAAHHAVLDMCAAPGSKSCQLVEMMTTDVAPGCGGGFVMANDASLDRAISLNHRLQSVNVASPATIITSLDARWWPNLRGLRFDRVLCDVPCSGDGTLRKRHKNTPAWAEGTALALHRTQVRLLRQGLRLLRPGGLLVYSTCR
jgi:16S rRNA C967 or C1407 C5-methylase (RsmB/RsmF family)